MKFLKNLFKKNVVAVKEKSNEKKEVKKFKPAVTKEEIRNEHNLKKESNRKIIAIAQEKKRQEEEKEELARTEQAKEAKIKREENMRIEREKNELKKKNVIKRKAKKVEESLDLYGFEVSTLEQGQMIKVEILQKDREYYIVRGVANYQEAFLPFNEVTIDVNTGDIIDVLVYRHTNEDFHVSQKRFVQRTEAKMLLDNVVENEVVVARVDKFSKPFFLVSLSNGLKGKVFQRNIDLGFVSEFEKYIGKEYSFNVKSKDENDRDIKLELDRRSYLLESQKAIVDNITIESTIKVNLLSANKGGLAAQYNSIRVFIPINELSHEYVSDTESFFENSEKVLEVKVVNVESKRGEFSIIASIKGLLKDPRDSFFENNHVDDVIKGRISKIERYGFFIQLAPSLRGLLHTNEMSPDVAGQIKNFKIGDEMTVRITSIDVESNRVSLTTMRKEEDQ